MERQGLNLHEYGLSKIAGSFNDNEKIIDDNGLDIINPYSSLVYFALDQFIIALKEMMNEDYKKPIIDALKTIKYQRLNDELD